MKIYKIRHTTFDYDFYVGHVVVANNESEVRGLAKSKKDGMECADVWDVASIECVGVYAGEEMKPFILLSDYRAG